jgi:hypothetical protein
MFSTACHAMYPLHLVIGKIIGYPPLLLKIIGIIEQIYP